MGRLRDGHGARIQTVPAQVYTFGHQLERLGTTDQHRWACPLSEVLWSRPSTQLWNAASSELPGVALPSECRRKDDSISDTHLTARLATAVSSKPSNSRSFDQRRRP